MTLPRFSVVGHRGAMAHAPENSVESFLLAERAGADEIELDVRCTADDVVIVLHDPTLDRITADQDAQGLGPVAELSYEQVRAVRLDSGRPVLTLAEAFEATTVTLQVEIKERRCVNALADLMATHPQYASRCIFTSFDADALEDLTELAPQVPRGLLVTDYPSDLEPEEVMALLARTGSSLFHCGWQGLTRGIVRWMHEAGVGVRCWQLRTLGHMRLAVDLGLDGITSDDPGLAREWYRQVSSDVA
jgi:glycerophosphoryl diester phosphodiesterase